MNANPSWISSSNRLYGAQNKKRSVRHETALIIRHEANIYEDSRLLYMPPPVLKQHGVVVKDNRFIRLFTGNFSDIKTRCERVAKKFVESHLLGDVLFCTYLRRRTIHDRHGRVIYVHGVMATVKLLEQLELPLVAAKPGQYTVDRFGAEQFFNDVFDSKEII